MSLARPSHPPARSIAVLPFVSMSDDPANEFFSDGITEEIINALTGIRGLSVTARTSAFAFKGKNIDIRDIGSQLGVVSILEGSVRKDAHRVRITAQLIRVDDGFHLWSERFDRKLEDIFAVQDEISLLIADQVRENFGHFDIADHLVPLRGIDVASYNAYLEGRFHLHRFNAGDIEMGIQKLTQVVQVRPDFALAHAAIHYGYNSLAAGGLMPVGEALTIGKQHLDRALALDETLPECHHSLGWHVLNQDWDFIEAVRHLTRAIELRPGYADAHQKLFITLVLEGNLELAYQHLQTAHRLDPLATMNNYFLGYYHYVTESLPAAHSHFQRTFELEPGFIVGYAICGLSLYLQGKPDEILDLAHSVPNMKGAQEERCILRTLAYLLMDRPTEVEEGRSRLHAALNGEQQERIRFFLIYIETVRGDIGTAFELIQSGIARREPLMTLLKIDPLLRPLHADPRWNEALAEIYALSQESAMPTPATATKQLVGAKEDLARLLDLMESEHPHLDPELSLRGLADFLDLHPNRLSRLLNEEMGQNFNEFVNRWRLEEFKAAARTPGNQHLTLLGIALQCGFNSKTVFNAFFKKTMGTTPRAWLDKHPQ